MAETNAPVFDPRLSRVVKIKVADESGEDTIGSGYLVAPGLVLTARHVLWRDGKPAEGDYAVTALRVRTATGPSAGHSLPVSNLVLLGDVSGVDVAVLVVPGLEPVAGTVVVGARFTADRPVPGCWMIGYPKAAHQDGRVGAEYVGVEVLPLNAAVASRFVVAVTTPPVRDDADWGGLSGSGVVDADGRMLGVVTEAQIRWEKRLAVAPIGLIVEAAGSLAESHPSLVPLAGLWVEEHHGTDTLFDLGKFPPRLTDLREESLFDALHFKHRVVPYIDRLSTQVDSNGRPLTVLEAAVAWVQATGDRPDLKIGTITGRAGAGKSRLAAEICDRVTASGPWWRAGFADHDKLAVASVPQVPTLVVCDYPERSPALVGAYLARIWEARRAGRLPAPVRILLVSRDTAAWHTSVRAALKNLDRLTDYRIELAPNDFRREVRVEHAAKALAAFWDGYEIPTEQHFDFKLEPEVLDRPLLVHIAALLAVRFAVEDPVGAQHQGRSGTLRDAEELIGDLISAEVERLLKATRAQGEKRAFQREAQVREALCVTTLTAPMRADLPELLALTESFGANGSGDRVAAADILLDLYPGGMKDAADRMRRSVAPVEPDLIAAHLLATTPGRADLVKRLVTAETVAKRPGYLGQLLSVLALASEGYAEVQEDLKAHLEASLAGLIDAGTGSAGKLAVLLETRLASLVQAAVDLAERQDLAAARQLAAALRLADMNDRTGIDRAAAESLWRVPYPHPGLAELGVALAERAVAYSDRNADLPRDARPVANGVFASWLYAIGRRDQALLASERAVMFFDELAESDQGYLPDLAHALTDHATLLGEAGRRAEALSAIQRALTLRMELTESSQADRLDLAMSLSSCANQLAWAGQWALALLGSERVVDIYEESAESDRGYLPKLALALTNHATFLALTGLWVEAVSASDRATEIYEELAESNRIAYLPDQAKVLTNHATFLAKTERWVEAVSASDRATVIYEELAESNRVAYLPDQAKALWDAASVRRTVGVELEAALEYCDRAVDLYRELASAEPAAFAPALAEVEALRDHLAK